MIAKIPIFRPQTWDYQYYVTEPISLRPAELARAGANLFHDSKVANQAWINIAKIYLNHHAKMKKT